MKGAAGRTDMLSEQTRMETSDDLVKWLWVGLHRNFRKVSQL